MLLPPLSPARAHELVSRLTGVRVLVIGDVMLDKFIMGRVTRISPEAPVPVVAFEHERVRLGGAANVAHNITALGGEAVLIAPAGHDDNAATLAEACHAVGIAPHLVSDPMRCTTTKVRVVTERNQQVARIDYEHDTEVAGDVEQRLLALIQQLAPTVSVVIVSDYLKGAVSKQTMETVMHIAAERALPVLVDPKVPHIDYYRGSLVVTPNTQEAEAATSQRVRDDESARSAARSFRERAGCHAVLITRGDQGMWLLSDDAEGSLAATAREVADVTGAGDTVIATMAIAIGAGATLAEAAWIANEAAAVTVGRFGPAAIARDELLAAVDRATRAR